MVRRKQVVECPSDEVMSRCKLDLSRVEMTESATAHAHAQRERAVALDAPPLTNRGGKENEPVPMERSEMAKAFEGISKTELVKLVLDDGAVKQVALRRPVKPQVAIVDTLRFTIGEESFGGGKFGSAERVLLDDEAYTNEISRVLFDVLGYGITGFTGHGGDFYKRTYTLGDRCGSVSMGGVSQNATILVSLTGVGCAAARDGWESRLFNFFMKYGKRASITRIDLAFDDLKGERVTVDIADHWYDDGGFTSGGRAPSYEHRGNWKKPDGTGRSLYVGKRQNGKMCRVYEKGMEQGDRNSSWCRVEVELRSKDRVIPLDSLLYPSDYFCGAYPCLAFLGEDVTATRIECKRKSAEINVDAAMGHIKRSYGAYVSVFSDLFGADEFIARVRIDDKIPARLVVPSHEACDTPYHLWPKELKTAGLWGPGPRAPGYASSAHN